MSSSASPVPKRSNAFAIVARVVVMTAAFGVLGLGLGGLMGILAVSIMNLAGQQIDMEMALFAGGVPGAAIGVLVGLVIIVRSERRTVRELRRLNGLY